jgi:hypothetical protein
VFSIFDRFVALGSATPTARTAGSTESARGAPDAASCRTLLDLQIEFDPPEQPGLRARIERLDDPD